MMPGIRPGMPQVGAINLSVLRPGGLLSGLRANLPMTSKPVVIMSKTEIESMDPPTFVEAPDHLQGAIDGSMRMKRHLEADVAESVQGINGSEPPQKKKRLVTMDH